METNLKSNSKGKVECVECGKQYASDRILNEHVATKHEGKSKSQCEDCDKVFTKARELEVHKMDHIDQFENFNKIGKTKERSKKNFKDNKEPLKLT
jgi:glycyl-tRNA synthetase (class II)